MASRATPGWIYILSNPAMLPGLLKIGHTTRSPEVRAIELADATGVPAAFVIERAFKVENSERMEAIVHGLLADRRPSPNREFFLVDVASAVAVVEAAIKGRRPVKDTVPPPLAVPLPKGWRMPVAPAVRLASDRAGQMQSVGAAAFLPR